MAAVRLTRYECERNLLPSVCARCGIPADTHVRITLLTPFWNIVLPGLMILCPPLCLILLTTLLKKRLFEVPMCTPDADDWNRRDRVTTISYLIMAVGAYIVAAAAIVLAPDDRLSLIEELAITGYFVSVYVWFVPCAILWTRTVRSTKAMKHGIRLSGLHEDFIRALMADRVQSRESDPARTAWYGDARDDFEEDWNVDGVFRPEVPPKASGQSRARSEPE